MTIMISLIVFITLINVIDAHNWINSISRSETASTVRPVVPSRTNRPHATVAPGQKFQIEYMCGHGDFSYFFVLSADDRANLGLHDRNMIKALLANQPAGQDVPLRNEYKKHHRKMEDNLHTKNGQNFFASLTKSGDAGYIKREVVFGGRMDGHGTRNKAEFTEENVETIIQAEYKDEHTVDDRRLTYYDGGAPADYSWLLEFRQYRMVTGAAGNPDVVLFEFPPGTPTGNYMIHYTWNGYYDVIDVKVVDTPTTNIYGVPPPPEKLNVVADYIRIDHCSFRIEQTVGGCQKITSDLSGCMRACEKLYLAQCAGVQVFPVSDPASRRLNTTIIPWDIGTAENKCPVAMKPYLKDTDFICVPINAVPPTETEQSIIVTTDPNAPEYYSTCHVRQPVLNEPPTPPPPRDLQWRKRDSCVSCKAAAAAQRDEQLWVDWQLNPPQYCVNCAREPVDPASLPPITNWTAINPFNERKSNSRFGDSFNGTPYKGCGFNSDNCFNWHDRYCTLRCHKGIRPVGGRAYISNVDCATAVLDDPDCDPDWVVIGTRTADFGRHCKCWTNYKLAEMTNKPAGCCPAPRLFNGTTHGSTSVNAVTSAFKNRLRPTENQHLGGNDALL